MGVAVKRAIAERVGGLGDSDEASGWIWEGSEGLGRGCEMLGEIEQYRRLIVTKRWLCSALEQ